MKQHRTLIVMAVAVATAGLAAFGVYQAIQRMPVRKVEMADGSGGGRARGLRSAPG